MAGSNRATCKNRYFQWDTHLVWCPPGPSLFLSSLVTSILLLSLVVLAHYCPIWPELEGSLSASKSQTCCFWKNYASPAAWLIWVCCWLWWKLQICYLCLMNKVLLFLIKTGKKFTRKISRQKWNMLDAKLLSFCSLGYLWGFCCLWKLEGKKYSTVP